MYWEEMGFFSISYIFLIFWGLEHSFPLINATVDFGTLLWTKTMRKQLHNKDFVVLVHLFEKNKLHSNESVSVLKT